MGRGGREGGRKRRREGGGRRVGGRGGRGEGAGREKEEQSVSYHEGLVQSLVEAMDSLHHLLRGGGVAIGTPHSIRHQPGKRWGSREEQ